jgi:phosphohistidine phosphatase
MALYLVQHGKSLAREEDPEQGLSAVGIAESERIAGVARNYGVKVSRIRHSPKKRARQTAEVFAAALAPEGGCEAVEGILPLDDVVAAARRLSEEHNLMLVGHLPFMSRLTSFLITGAVESPVFKFQNSGIVCLKKDPDGGGWVIRWTLMPHIA